MNCNVPWYLQSGDCLPMWCFWVYMAVGLVVAVLWADLFTFRFFFRKVFFPVACMIVFLWFFWRVRK